MLRQTRVLEKDVQLQCVTMWHKLCDALVINLKHGGSPMISLTDNAVSAVKKAIAKSGKEGAGFRIMVESGGCSGLKYKIGLDTSPRQDDEIVAQGDIKVFIDQQSKPMVAGMTVDFVEEIGKAGFSFDNPNAKAKCNCGKSFC